MALNFVNLSLVRTFVDGDNAFIEYDRDKKPRLVKDSHKIWQHIKPDDPKRLIVSDWPDWMLNEIGGKIIFHNDFGAPMLIDSLGNSQLLSRCNVGLGLNGEIYFMGRIDE